MSPLTILVVDDNHDAADTLAVLLRVFGHTVRVAYGGEAALQVTRDFIPDCALLDINMPGIDGIMLARQFRADPATARIKLIAFTAYSDDRVLQKVRDTGFDHYLQKTADLEELQGVLRMIEKVKQLAETTEEIARRNLHLADQTKQLLEQAKSEFTETKAGIGELKADLGEVKEELKEVKGALKEVKEGLAGLHEDGKS